MKIVSLILLISFVCTLSIFAATTTTATPAKTVSPGTSSATIPAKPAEKKWNYTLVNVLEGRNYYNSKLDAANYYYIAPDVTYKFSVLPVTAGGTLYVMSNLNQVDNYGHKADIDVLAFYASAPIWKNTLGTALTTYTELDLNKFSTEKNFKTNRTQRQDGTTDMKAYLTLAQTYKKVSLSAAPNVLYSADPNYTRGSLNYRSAVDVSLKYAFTKNFKAYYTQKIRKYNYAVTKDPTMNNWLIFNYPGFIATYKNWTLNAYLYAIATTQTNSFEAMTYKTAKTMLELYYNF